ncbi:MAG: non-ribosomal peptide synthetase, partial [bacterium]|nr:non-ribosomal peptide synthetase [bacterium]
MNDSKTMERKNIADIAALTPLQEGMLYHYLKEPGSSLYFEQLSLELDGKIDTTRFEQAWNVVIASNEMLRTLFRWEKVEHPIQIILKEHKLLPAYCDFTGLASGNHTVLEKIKNTDRQNKFDLRKVPFRVTLCHMEKEKQVMIISNHHIIYDGWSNGIILKEFFKAYNGLSQGKALEALEKPLKTRFKKFVKWGQVQDEEKQETFWRDYLKDFDPHPSLPVKTSTASVGTVNSEALPGTYRSQLGKELTAKLEAYAKQYKITPASLLYSAWGLLLQKYHNSRDVVFGTTVSGRSANIKGIENMVGLFINTLPLRVLTNTTIHKHKKIHELPTEIDRALQKREAFDSSSLVKIKEYSELTNSEELFDTIVVIENYPLDSRLTREKDNLSVAAYSIFAMTNFDLTLGIVLGEDISLDFTYLKEYFEEKTIKRLARHFAGILETALTNPADEITALEMVTREEKEQILYEFNEPGT